MKQAIRGTTKRIRIVRGKGAATAASACLAVVLLTGCGQGAGGGSLERDLMQLVKAEYEGTPQGCMHMVAIESVRRFPVQSTGFRSDTRQDFGVLIANGLVEMQETRPADIYTLTPAGESFFHEGTGLCFAELSVERLVNVSAPFEERGRTYVTATAEMSVSVPGFALEDRFFQFVRGSLAGFQMRDLLAAKRAGEPYRQEFTFIKQDDGWAIEH
jgi:hypothetical protein